MKLPAWITLFTGIKQGIPQPKPVREVEEGEYETYIDPKCGCKKRRKVIKPKIEENEPNVEIQSEQVRTENANTNAKRSRRSSKSNKSTK